MVRVGLVGRCDDLGLGWRNRDIFRMGVDYGKFILCFGVRF